MSRTAIADHALLSDCHSAALVTTGGSVDWLCFPRFDAPSVFARMLDDGAGHWSIVPTAPAETSRRYRDRSMVLETTFRTPGGTAVLTEGMALAHDQPEHDLGANAPGVLLRRIACTEGEVEIEVEYAPRPEYGLVVPTFRDIKGGLFARGGADVLVLSSPVALERDHSVARARVTLRAGEALGFALDHASSWEPSPRVWTQGEIQERLDWTEEAWGVWSDAHQNYEGPWEELVYHSGRVLQALAFQPTGAIVAAPTTSLPEALGGERNWDYRYAWVRDASFTLDALWVAACPDEANAFFDWMAGAVASQVHLGEDLQIMFGIGGERDLTERELGHLSGWRESRPVRVGNGAWDQRQLDVYGELLGAAQRLRERLGMLDEDTRQLFVDAAEAAAARWKETDQGIWEVRGGDAHFLYSKLMCWVALDRAIALAADLHAQDRVERWTATREEIREAILSEGWSEDAKAFTQSFGSTSLDASNLMMPIVGFLPADDARMLATIDAIECDLTDDRGLVYRYRVDETDDGLAGEEGTFLLCTFWLAQAQAMAGRIDRARETFERAIAFANDVGLLSEEVEPGSGELLGNFPQAFSHIGLVNAAWAISQAERGMARASSGGASVVSS